jgi:hypothetical protein
LKVRSLVFPFNVYNQTLSEKVMEKFTTYRRRGEQFPLAEGKGADGSMPGKGIDLAGYIPLDLLLQWIEYAQSQNKMLFLYGHDVLPDEKFVEGRVASVTPNTIAAVDAVFFPEKEGICLVPDKDLKAKGNPLRVQNIQGKEIKASPADLTQLTKPGATFILGPCYGTPLGYFQKFIAFAAPRVKFLTTAEALSGEAIPSSQEKTDSALGAEKIQNQPMR